MAETTTAKASSAPSEVPLGSLQGELRAGDRVLVVVAHPDDESFGLGGVIAWLSEQSVTADLVCFTAGEASTFGESADLGAVRATELYAAAAVLGIRDTWLEGMPDGALIGEQARLEAVIEARLGDAAALVCLEPSGVTGHPDHRTVAAATTAVAARRGLPVLEWGVTPAVAAALAAELGAELSGLDGPDVVEVRVDRARQLAAIACHVSQDPANKLLARRLELQGSTERLRVRSAPFDARLARFVTAAGPLAREDAPFCDRERLLDLLVRFAAGTTWPPGAFNPDADGTRPYGVYCLHDDPAGWSIASLVLDAGQCTPPHEYETWGAAATVTGVERNVRFAGRCPERLRPLGTQLSPPGAGYVFDTGDIYQASNAAGRRTVSVRLLVKGAHHPHERRREPSPLNCQTSTT